MSGGPELFETLIWEQDGQVVTLTLNRPDKKNAMSWTMFRELGEAFEKAALDDDVRCVVITGSGDSFCSGADLTDPENIAATPFELKARMRKIDAIARSIITCPKPTVARVTGVAAGAGCNLALGCDLVVASRTASFAELFVKRGLVVDFGGSWALTRVLPLHRAKEMALLGETISAAEAHAMGLLNRLCEPDEIDEIVKDFSTRLAALPPRTVAQIKENLNKASESTLDETLETEAVTQALMFASEDTREAVAAWVEKREPRFTGR
jgi:enoyl-CoA hydratase/carnithine racemase